MVLKRIPPASLSLCQAEGPDMKLLFGTAPRDEIVQLLRGEEVYIPSRDLSAAQGGHLQLSLAGAAVLCNADFERRASAEEVSCDPRQVVPVRVKLHADGGQEGSYRKIRDLKENEVTVDRRAAQSSSSGLKKRSR